MPETKYLMNKLLKDVEPKYQLDGYNHEVRKQNKKANLLKNFSDGLKALIER